MSEEIKNEKGGISVETEHIFPIIKRWLYSEKEIFLREIVSNACDAETKLKRLSSLGEVRDIDDDFRIFVTSDRENKTLTVSDNGIGMTADELRSYICQIALSGALDFISKYEGEDAKSDDAGSGIIGHFGLGFYSSFMVSDKVEVVTKSYTDSPAVRWVCVEEGEYEIFPGEREGRGTDVIMHISEDEEQYLEKSKLEEILRRYCSFLPYPIYLVMAGEEKEEEEKKKDDSEDAEAPSEPKPINDTHPLWQKNPSDCTDEEYLNFYRAVFMDYREPLFHIHINADYPLDFKGILYFPRLNSEYDSLEGQVKLYYNQVFVADNIKEVLPEYLLMLRGVIDCPELPLNVSRSYMQNDAYVRRIGQHITKKVADKLNSMFNTDREKFEKIWPDVKLFIEYACLRDNKFYDRIKDSVLLQTVTGEKKTLSIGEYIDSMPEDKRDTVWYATDAVEQSQYISMYEAEGMTVCLLDRTIDTSFISIVENDRKIKFLRVDSSVADALKADGEEFSDDELRSLFERTAGEGVKVSFENLRNAAVPAILNISEESRRMEDMMKMYNRSSGDFTPPKDASLILNSASPLIRRLAETKDERVARQIYSLAVLSQRRMTPDEMKGFISDSVEILSQL